MMTTNRISTVLLMLAASLALPACGGGDDLAIDASSGFPNDAQIAFDGDGNALALWYQTSGVRNVLWWNYYTAGTGWGTAELLPNGSDPSVGNPRGGFDADGDALVVWTQSVGPGPSMCGAAVKAMRSPSGRATARCGRTGSSRSRRRCCPGGRPRLFWPCRSQPCV
jgi:hypothetical protein